MAKLALVRYGSEGEGPKEKNGERKAYTYVVNDNVRAGDHISPIVKHAKSGTIFATTGVIQSTAKNASTEKGKEMMADFEKAKENPNAQQKLTNVYTAKELGIKPEKDASGKFIQQGQSSPTRSNRPKGTPYVAGRVESATKGGNMLAYEMEHGKSNKVSEATQRDVDTFMGYSEPFVPTGKR